MIIGVLNETIANSETRVALIPDTVKKMMQWKNVSVLIEHGAGAEAGYPDVLFENAGATLTDCATVVGSADIIIMINYLRDPKHLKKGAVVIGQFDPYRNLSLVEQFAAAGLVAVSMDMIPRSTIAQKMDVLSSQASLAGYRVVIEAAKQLHKVFPMMTTPSGTITPMKVFIIGAGVAGLQAIATAKRIGANVFAYDTRPVVEEQVKSLGAKFIKIDLDGTGQTKDGYAKALTDEQLKQQQQQMKKTCIQSDLVITTAKLFGKKAPVIITDDILKEMKEGSLVIDMAADTGGNVEGSCSDKLTVIHGVQVLGYGKPELDVAFNASQMYANNIFAFLQMFWDQESGIFTVDAEHEILHSTILTKNGAIVHSSFQSEK